MKWNDWDLVKIVFSVEQLSPTTKKDLPLIIRVWSSLGRGERDGDSGWVGGGAASKRERPRKKHSYFYSSMKLGLAEVLIQLCFWKVLKREKRFRRIVGVGKKSASVRRSDASDIAWKQMFCFHFGTNLSVYGAVSILQCICYSAYAAASMVQCLCCSVYAAVFMLQCLWCSV